MSGLRDGGFENWATPNHKALAILPNGTTEWREVENITLPVDWNAWFMHEPGTWDQPECKRMLVSEGYGLRVRSGAAAVCLFTCWRNHLAGYMQQVAATVGQRYLLTACAHAWSNGLAPEQGGHPNDGNWSDGAGTTQAAWPQGAWPEVATGDPQADARWNFVFKVGIDPTGGINPMADTVVWGQGWSIYNGYCQLLSVEAIAQSAQITVFLRSRTHWLFQHNDAYWDDTELAEIGEPQPEPEPTMLPGSDAREPYDRTVVLMPPGATEVQWHAAVDRHYPFGHTITGSADDAGVGRGLKSRTVIAVNPQAWANPLEPFFDEFYPGVVYQTEQDYTDVLLWQKDPRWAMAHLGAAGCTSTIGGAGCFVTSLAAAQRFYGIDRAATPLTVQPQVNFSGCNVASLKATSGLKLSRTDSAAVAKVHLDFDFCAMAEVLPTTLEHFVLVIKRDRDRYWMLDPLTGKQGYLADTYQGVESWRLLEPIVAPEPPATSPRTTRDTFSVHVQGNNGFDLVKAYVAQAKPTVVKFVGAYERAKEIMALSPDTRVVLRRHVEGYDGLNGTTWVAAVADSLRALAAWYAANYPGKFFLFEGPNEYCYNPDHNDVVKAVAFDMEVVRAVQALGLPQVRPAVMCAAVGNPDIPDYPLLVPLGRAVEQAGGAFGYHAYWWANPQTSGLASAWWPYHAGRWQEMDKVLVANGVKVNWYSGETGAVGSTNGYNLLGNDGWKAASCYNGDWTRYQADIREFVRRGNEWNATHDWRWWGGCGFTIDGSGWDSFEYRDELTAIAAATA